MENVIFDANVDVGEIEMKSLQLISMIIITIISLVIISNPVIANDKYSVSGNISFKETEGQLVVRLMTSEEFENKLIPPSERVLNLSPNQQELDAKIIAFKFNDVPKGKYCSIHDQNSNGKMDLVPNVGIPAEPHAFSGEYMWEPWWEDVSFDVDKDINGIEIKFK